MNAKVDELVEWVAEKLCELEGWSWDERPEIARHYLHHPIKETFRHKAKQILFQKDEEGRPILAMINREIERPKFYPRGTTGLNTPVQVNIPKVVKDLYNDFLPVIPLAEALRVKQ